MGHKINPIGMRLGIIRTWDSRWYAGKDYAKLLHEDIKLREHLRKRLSQAGVSKVVIERPAKKPRVTIYAARPGVVIGKKGQDIDTLRKELSARRASASIAAAVWVVPKSRGWNGIVKAACRCTRCAPISITASPPPRPPMAPAA
jgi:small subunit ribosomal protein S3